MRVWCTQAGVWWSVWEVVPTADAEGLCWGSERQEDSAVGRSGRCQEASSGRLRAVYEWKQSESHSQVVKCFMESLALLKCCWSYDVIRCSNWCWIWAWAFWSAWHLLFGHFPGSRMMQWQTRKLGRPADFAEVCISAGGSVVCPQFILMVAALLACPRVNCETHPSWHSCPFLWIPSSEGCSNQWMSGRQWDCIPEGLQWCHQFSWWWRVKFLNHFLHIYIYL